MGGTGAAAARVSVVMVTYNSAAVIRQTLPELRGMPHLYVVDNASSDETLATVHSLAPQAHIISNPVNQGFGAANNLALEQVGTEFALLLNPDCTFAPAALDELVAAADRYPDAALLGAKLYNPDGGSELSYRAAFFEQRARGAYLEPAGDLCADFLVGTGLLLRMSMMRPLGFFDPNIFLYFDDDELCLRARRAGHALVLVNGARILHLGGKSSMPSAGLTYRRYFHYTRSQLYLLAKYRGVPAARRTAGLMAAASALKFLLYAVAFNRTLLIRSVARIRAVLTRPWQTAPRP